MVFCLDTQVVIDILHGDEKLRGKINELDHFAISSIVMCDLNKCAFLAKQKDAAVALVHVFICSADILPFDESSCKLFGEKCAELRRAGNLIQEADLMIGCVALSHNATIVTRNMKDFSRISGLSVVEW